LAAPSHGAQWALVLPVVTLVVLRTLVVPLSGSIFSTSAKSNSVPLARSLSARPVAALNSACLDDGMPQRMSRISRPSAVLMITGAG
jgi:hypothetical protein